MYAVACGVNDVYLRDKLKNHTLSLIDAFTRSDVQSFEENVFVFDLVLENAAALRFTADENHRVLNKELGVFKDEFTTNIRGAYSVSGITDFRKLFPEKTFETRTSGAAFSSLTGSRSHNPTNRGDAAERQRTILGLLREKGSAPLMDFLIRFPELNEKTIRNDLNSLCLNGYVTRVGRGGRGSRYEFLRDIVVT